MGRYLSCGIADTIYINNLEDEELVSFFESELESHKETKNDLINMLEVKCNG